MNRELRAKAFDLTNILLFWKNLLTHYGSSAIQWVLQEISTLQRTISDFAKTLNVTFGAETERVKPSPPTSKQIGAVFVNTELCLLKVRAKLSPRVGVCWQNCQTARAVWRQKLSLEIFQAKWSCFQSCSSAWVCVWASAVLSCSPD